MPVSLSEWRVRIGTFVHWIREYEVKERRERLLKERIRRLKVLCERLEAKIGESGEESEDDKSRQDGPDRKGCPHKTSNFRSSGNSSDIKDLLTSCDQCIQDLLSASDSHIKELLTPSDTCIKQLLTPRRERLQRIQRLKVLVERLEAKRDDSREESEDDKSRQDDPDPKGCPHKTLNIRSSGNSSGIKDLLTSCDQCIQDLLTASDSHIKDIVTPSGCSIKELITPNDCSIKSPNTLNDSTIKDIITQNDSGLKELVTTNDSRITNLVKANDYSRIQGLFKANDDSRIGDLLTTNYSSIRDPIAPKYCSIKGVTVSKNAGTKPLDTPNDSLNASSIKDLITPNDSSIIDLITSEYSDVKDLITSNDSKIDSLLIPNENNIKRLIKPDDDYSEEQLAQAYNYVNIVRTIDDESIEQDTQVGDSEEQHMSDISISPRHSLPDASLRELFTSSFPSTKDLQTPPDDLNADLIIKTPYIKDHETQSDGPVRELSPDSGITVYQPFALCDDFLVELLKPSKDVPSIDLHVCCHEPDRRNEPFSEESGKLPHFVCKEQHPQPDTITKEATDDELLKEHQTSSGSCKKSQTEPSIHTAVKCSPGVPIVSRKYCINDRHGEMGESCNGPSLKSKTDLISEQIPPLSELLLLKSGDVELNPGPREAAGWSLELERELLSLVKDVSPVHYYDLCNALDVSHAQSQVILTKNLLDVSNSLSEVICSWGDKQRDGTNYKRLLAEKLRSVHLDALGTKLEEGGYSTQDIPSQSSVTDEVHTVNKLTQEEVIRCGKDFKTFYRTEMCKIKTDPLDFDSLKEFEDIYTNLVLLRNKIGKKIKTPLVYDDLLTKQINGEFPKRLLVEGEGGAGKTTYCSKIAWDWANGYKAYEHFDWVIVIPMRGIQNCKTVGDIAKTYLSDGNMVIPRQIDDYILSEPSKVLIIFDGLDEYSRDIFSDESDFGKLIRSEKFKECIILITSRPWKASQIKLHKRLRKIYTFIGIEGFSSENVSSYINKYFADDNMAGADLITFMEDNDVIQKNMAPFPIYVAMLCILWRESTEQRREVIRELKTFSQLFHQMIAFLKQHYITKSCNTLTEFHSMETEINQFLIEIGKIAFSGLLDKRLTFNENDFSLCKEAMDVCSKIGILSREKQFVRRVKKAGTKIQPVTFDVSFPHKLFQEYVAALYLTSLYESKDVEYTTSINILEAHAYEFKYLLYFTSSQGKGVGLDIINRLVKQKCSDDFLVDVTFEAYDTDSGKAVGQRIFREEKSLEINSQMSAHTLSGYLFIMEQHAIIKTFILRRRECGPTVSRDLADALSSQTSLTTLTLSETKFHDDLYRILLDHVSTSKIQECIISNLYSHDNQSASYCLGKFLSLLSHLTHLEIYSCSFHHDFYKEIADRASSSLIQKCIINFLDLHVDQSASCCLGKFLGLLPHLTHLEICSCSFHGDFYKEIADQASSSQIQTVHLDFILVLEACSASKQLAKFLCSLPCLTNLEISGDKYLHDDFFTELESLAASSQNPYFREKKHISMLQEWSVRKQEQQQQQQLWSELQQEQQQEEQQWWSLRRYKKQQQLNQCERPMPSTHQQPYLPHHVPLLESAQPSGQYQSDPHRGIQSEPQQTDQSTTYQQLSPIMPLQSAFAPDQLTKHLEEFDQYLQSYLSAQHNASNGLATQYSANFSSQETLQHSPHHGLAEATQDTAVSQRQEYATPIENNDISLASSSEYINYLTSVYQGGQSIGMKPFYEKDDSLTMPSTSGSSSAQSRTDAAPVENEQIPEHRKRIHSDEGNDDDGDRVDESLEQRPRKRRAKTDRQPTSP